ncbi:hypothetical protein EXT44_25460 [Klebsiella pneumoniae]|nr:hypothetical protein EXT44_25460 [Klebsiella pneumoniae]
MVVLVGLAIDQIAQSGLSSLSVIYYSAQLFRIEMHGVNHKRKLSPTFSQGVFYRCIYNQ